ncbi:hypothetical protein O988_05633, partial [Pseudogymnoascus sp. VKM F-3808]
MVGAGGVGLPVVGLAVVVGVDSPATPTHQELREGNAGLCGHVRAGEAARDEGPLVA